MPNPGLKDTHVAGRSSEGVELRGTPLRLDRHAVVFETFRQGTALKLSEVLSGFKIVFKDRTIYEGRAVVTSVVDGGVTLTCAANLDDGWRDVNFPDSGVDHTRLQEDFRQFLGQWEHFYRVSPEFKVAVSDLHTFLTELRLWTEQVELGLRSGLSGAGTERTGPSGAGCALREVRNRRGRRPAGAPAGPPALHPPPTSSRRPRLPLRLPRRPQAAGLRGRL
jgi:hypothetical protein